MKKLRKMLRYQLGSDGFSMELLVCGRRRGSQDAEQLCYRGHGIQVRLTDACTEMWELGTCGESTEVGR